MADLPIVVLAFANDQEGRRYLRDLPAEMRQLRGLIKEAERNGLCRLELLPNATLGQIFDVFTRNRDQVAILHYAGHADSGRLLLESSAAGGAPAHAEGLAVFLGQHRGLQLVFLNGCSTRTHIALLLKSGVAAVIATARAINDVMAREFAVAFYTELASGAPLRAGYEAARGRVMATHDKDPGPYYQKRELKSESSAADVEPGDDDGFPWEFRTGTELAERFSLPDAASNPEFGLPSLPERDLPEVPFRHLSWFTAEHAEVFFGRGHQIRELYDQVTDAGSPPILLLYGASGVGKSSLLDAGLVPRLEAVGDVVQYRRRDECKGLLGTLRDALHLAGKQTALDQGWRAEEARLGKPLVVFLDQVEEVFTRPDPARPHELDEFLEALAAALHDREARPRGKLVLGFRKEWLAELDRRMAEAKLARNAVFLKPLDRRGIIEAIRGPARPGRLQRKYRLEIEEGLPEVIADNLLADAGSALASTLEVLLNKMWERARQAHPDQPRFDRALYETLKAEGYLLKDVLDEGLREVCHWNSAVEQSGLALDVLAYHTTDLGTAAQRCRGELYQMYAHQVQVLEGLLTRCKDKYLLIEADQQTDAFVRSTRLAHDLLAPLVQHRFRLSVAPGQRARRLLENRAPEWQDGKTGPVFDRTDLVTIDGGASGMRVPTADENRLVEASRQADLRLKQEEAEQLRRIREAEDGQKQAEAAARREAERRLAEEEKARQAAEQHLREQEKTSRRLRLRAYALGAALAVVVVAAFLAWREYRRAVNASTDRALAQVDDLMSASSQAVSEILKSVQANPEAMAKLHALKSQSTLTEKQRVRVGIALLKTDPSESKLLFDRLLKPEPEPQELLLISHAVEPLAASVTQTLWQTVEDAKSRSELWLPYSAALAIFSPGDERWKKAGQKVGPALLDANPLHLGTWTDAFRPVKEHIIASLITAFHGEDPNDREAAANILADYASNKAPLLIDLLMDSDATQYRVLLAKIHQVAGFEAIKKAMEAELAKAVGPRTGYAERERDADRKANAIVTLVRQSEAGRLWPALRHVPDSRLRSKVIEKLGAFGLDMNLLVEHLSLEQDPSVRAAIVLALGKYSFASVPGGLRKSLSDRLLHEYESDPDPGLHSAVFWLLRNWGYLNELHAADGKLAGATAGSRSWYVNREGQTFVIVKQPEAFAMGSPPEEVEFGRNKVEHQHHRTIPRSFAICTHEVTVAEFYAFLSDPAARGLGYRPDDQLQFSPALDGPIISVTWFEAAKYCRWLSDREKFSEDEMCYPKISEIGENMQLPVKYLTRTGYRLPTEAEWEYSCRAGTETPWVFGSDPRLLNNYARHNNNSIRKNARQAGSICMFMPNRLGLFDAHGNVNEWCFDRNPAYPEADGPPVVDREQDDPMVRDSELRIYRGGSFVDLPPMLRSAYRDGARPLNRFPAVGFRVARTMSRN